MTATLRELRDTPVRRTARAHPAFWDDPDLAPAPREETPLDAWA